MEGNGYGNNGYGLLCGREVMGSSGGWSCGVIERKATLHRMEESLSITCLDAVSKPALLGMDLMQQEYLDCFLAAGMINYLLSPAY